MLKCHRLTAADDNINCTYRHLDAGAAISLFPWKYIQIRTDKIIIFGEIVFIPLACGLLVHDFQRLKLHRDDWLD